MSEEIIVSRIQHRRGLRTNLPQPLRAGEIGFTIDTKELFIGADLSDTEAQIWNRSVQIDSILNAEDTAEGLLNNRFMKLSMPVRQVASDGSVTYLWNPTVEGTFGLTKIGGVPRTTFNTITGQPFVTEDVVVAINDTVLEESEYTFTASSPTLHSVEFNDPPNVGATITVTYYGREGMIHLLKASPEVAPFFPTTLPGFYIDQDINDHRRFEQVEDSDLVRFDPQTGVIIIGYTRIVTEEFVEGVPLTFPIPATTEIEISTISGTTGSVNVSGATSIANIISILNPVLVASGITEIELREIQGDPDNFFAIVSIDDTSFTLSGANLSNLGLTAGTFTPANASVVAKLENYLGAVSGALDDEDINILTNAEVGNSRTSNINETFINELNNNLFITYDSFGQAENITDLLNRIYLEQAAPPFIRPIAVVKSNIRITTELDRLRAINDIIYTNPAEFELLGNTLSFTPTNAEFVLADTDSIILEYSIRLDEPPNHLIRTGILLMNGSVELADVTLRDDSTETTNFVDGTGEIELSARYDNGRIVLDYLNTFTEAATLKFIIRRWRSI